MPFKFTDTALPGLLLIEIHGFADKRGIFMETYKASEFKANGISESFVQDNHSYSKYGVLRGLHFQRPPFAQGKLVGVVVGTVWDVAVDLRRDSPFYGKWHGVTLSETNHFMLYVPPGFAHGFVTLSEEAHLLYKCTAEYDRGSESGIRWNDPEIGIEWPLRDVTISERDAALPCFKDLA
jgi:dTDP-4-dehydrorhamnose 3,5-epimerase